jgi:hypothetical protein
MAHHGELSSRAARGFNRSLHVSKQKIVPDYGPVYVGQTFEVPVTVIAQAQSGVVCVLAVFTSEQMSLRRHIETIVKPWLVRHTSWALRGRQLFGSYPGEGDGQQQWPSQLILEEMLLGGDWSPAQKPWESRKDSILDVLAKAVPGAFKPALQINATEARLLIDALSGRWSYEKNRRDTRTVWHYVADAFSCAIGRVEPDGPVKPKTVTVITARGPIMR